MKRLFKEIEEHLKLLNKWKMELRIRNICEDLIEDFTLTKELAAGTIESARLYPDSNVDERLNEYLYAKLGDVNGKMELLRKIKTFTD